MRVSVVSSFIVVLLLLSLTTTPSLATDNATDSAYGNSPSKELRAEKEALKNTIKAEKEAFKTTVTAAKDDFKERLALIKDERKKAIVDRLNTKVPTTNQNLTMRMEQAVTKMAAKMESLKAKAATLKQNGTNTTTLDAAITAAETALTKAAAAISTQAGKEYRITITTESNLRGTTSPVVKQMSLDMRATYQTVLAAHKALLKAEEELRLLTNASQETTREATGAAQ